MLGATLLIGVMMGWVVKERQQSAREREIGRQLAENGWSVTFCAIYDRRPYHNEYDERAWWIGLTEAMLGQRISCLNTPYASIEDFQKVAQLTRLKFLAIGKSEIQDLSPLANCSQLTALCLHESYVQELTPLVGLKQLDSLILKRARVQDLTPIVNHANLRWLDFSGTQITDISSLKCMTRLWHLNVCDSGVSREEVEALQSSVPSRAIEHDSVH